MKYLGSKRRIAEQILPIILSGRAPGQFYVEPMCGGCNSIDRVFGPRIASDANPYLIAMFKALQGAILPPSVISRELYNEVRESYKNGDSTFSDALKGFVGFLGSFNGRFFDGGYVGNSGGKRDYYDEARRNLLAQAPSLMGIHFCAMDYKKLTIPPNSIVYFDPPYVDTKGYNYGIVQDEFWEHLRKLSAEGHKVYVSEYSAPCDFFKVWEGNVRRNTKSVDKSPVTEKLFTLPERYAPSGASVNYFSTNIK